jgi:hypothetical protein
MPSSANAWLALAQDLPALWQAETPTAAERKPLLRWLIKDIVLPQQAKTVRVEIRWQTEACTHLEVARPPRAYEARRTDAAVVEQVRRLADRYTDAQVAEYLNAQGFLPGMGGRFTADKVPWIRSAYRIPSGCPQAPGACSGGEPRGWTLQCPGGGAALERRCLHHRRLVQERPAGLPAKCPSWPALGYTDRAGGDSPAQARSTMSCADHEACRGNDLSDDPGREGPTLRVPFSFPSCL